VKILWTSEAQQDRADIWDYIAMDNRQAAMTMDESFSDAVTRLAEYPFMGRPGTIPGTRELIPHESYRLVYELAGETLWILALVHTSRRWPPGRD
jgi:toxin ParE1/3/4